jgi:hypothetical protein
MTLGGKIEAGRIASHAVRNAPPEDRARILEAIAHAFAPGATLTDAEFRKHVCKLLADGGLFHSPIPPRQARPGEGDPAR